MIFAETMSSLVCLEHRILLEEFFVKIIRSKAIKDYESQSKKYRFNAGNEGF